MYTFPFSASKRYSTERESSLGFPSKITSTFPTQHQVRRRVRLAVACRSRYSEHLSVAAFDRISLVFVPRFTHRALRNLPPSSRSHFGYCRSLVRCVYMQYPFLSSCVCPSCGIYAHSRTDISLTHKHHFVGCNLLCNLFFLFPCLSSKFSPKTNYFRYSNQ